MPLYVFRCDACGSVFERRVPMSERGSVSCPSCSGTTTIVPQRFFWGFPLWANPHADVPTKEDLAEPSGLLAQAERGELDV